MQIKKIWLETARLNELAKFYHEVLGLPTKITSPGELLVQAGESELVFKTGKNNENPFYHFAFNIPYRSIEAARQWLKEKVQLLWIGDYHAESAEFTNWKARAIYFMDPAGNVVECIGRKDFFPGEKVSFDPCDILSISEIGLVFHQKEYDIKVKETLEKYELDFFSRQKPLPGFCAIGNDEGLLIVVHQQRNWYPTRIPSQKFPLKAEIHIEGKSYLLT